MQLCKHHHADFVETATTKKKNFLTLSDISLLSFQFSIFTHREKKRCCWFEDTFLRGYSNPNQQRTLNKLPSELCCRKSCYEAPTEHASRRPNVRKRQRDVYLFRLNFHFACHGSWLGFHVSIPPSFLASFLHCSVSFSFPPSSFFFPSLFRRL